MDFYKFKKIILGSIFGVLGLGFLIYGLIKLNEANQSKSWPKTKGTILSSKIENKVTTTRKKIERKEKQNTILLSATVILLMENHTLGTN